MRERDEYGPFARVVLTAWTCGVIFLAWWLMAGMPTLPSPCAAVRGLVAYKLFGRL